MSAAIPQEVRTTNTAEAWRRPSRINPVLCPPWVSPAEVPPQFDGLYLAMYVETDSAGNPTCPNRLPIDELIYGDYALGHLSAKDASSDTDAVVELGWFQDHWLTGHPIPRQVVAYVPIDMSLRAPQMQAMRARLLALMAEG